MCDLRVVLLEAFEGRWLHQTLRRDLPIVDVADLRLDVPSGLDLGPDDVMHVGKVLWISRVFLRYHIEINPITDILRHVH